MVAARMYVSELLWAPRSGRPMGTGRLEHPGQSSQLDGSHSRSEWIALYDRLSPAVLTWFVFAGGPMKGFNSSQGNRESAIYRYAQLIDRFEKEWQERGTANISDFLPPAPSQERDGLLHELIKIDLDYRWSRGQKRRVEDYASEFPELGAGDKLPTDLIVEEAGVRRRYGHPISSDELAARFPQRLAELLNATDEHVEGTNAEPDMLQTELASGSDSSAIQTRQISCRSTPREVATNVTTVRSQAGHIGRYELLEQVGRGAFSVVHRAWDPELQREVAIKLQRPEFMEQAGANARVLREAQSAARLRHPAIVPIHEVGQMAGTPFIVYDFIPGRTLAQLVSAYPATPEQAAHWVARLAEALDYAHQCGVVHRDIKPANIMMDSDGQPMIADFGLALHTDAAATLTREGDVLGTPAYISPEQARGEGHQADARTDEYSLGVVLYELLTGRLPFEGSAASVLQKVIHEEPRPPRNWRPGLPLDLETICLRAMAKERQGRYPTAGAMAEDLRRFLAGEPIWARPIGTLERLRKWMKRRPAAAALVAVSAALFLTVLVGSLWYNARLQAAVQREHEQRKTAEANFKQARDAVDQMLIRIGSGPLANVPQMQHVSRQLLEDALRFYESFLRQKSSDPDVRHETARAYRRVADIRRKLGQHGSAKGDYEKALGLADRLASDFPDRPAYQQHRIEVRLNFAELLTEINQRDDAEAYYREALDISGGVVDRFPREPAYGQQRANCFHDLGRFLADQGRYEEAAVHYRQALEIQKTLVEESATQTSYRTQLARTYNNLGLLLRNTDRLDEARGPLEDAVSLHQLLVQDWPEVAEHRHDLANSYNNLGILLWDLNRNDEAELVYRQALELQEQLARDFPEVPDYRWELGGTLHNLAELSLARDHLSDSRDYLLQAIRHQRAAVQANPRDLAYRAHLRNHYWALSEALMRLGDHEAACAAAQELPRTIPEGWEEYHRAGLLIIQCAIAAEKDSNLEASQRTALVAQYVDRTVDLLREAVKRGYRDPVDLKRFPHFDRLSAREDFLEILRDLEAGTGKP